MISSVLPSVLSSVQTPFHAPEVNNSQAEQFELNLYLDRHFIHGYV